MKRLFISQPMRGKTDEERRLLMLDAYDRAREAGIPINYNKNARRIVYGYE